MAMSDPPTNPSSGAMPGMRLWAGLGQGEQVALAGALVLLVVGDWLFSDLIGWGGVPLPIAVAAAEAALLIVARALRPATAWPLPFAMLLAGLAVVVVVPTISDILATVRNSGFLSDGGTLIAVLVDWIAALAVGVGAWMTWQRERG